MDILTKRKAVSRFLPNERLLLTNINDTDYVYDVAAEAWSTWTDMPFSDGVLFDTGYALQNVPGSSFYFTKPGTTKLYKWPSGTTDAGVQFAIDYQTPPLWGGFDKYQLTKIGLVTRNCVAGSDYLVMEARNHRDSSILNDSLGADVATKELDKLVNGYSRFDLFTKPAVSARLRLYSVPIGSVFSQGAIDAIVIEKKRLEALQNR